MQYFDTHIHLQDFENSDKAIAEAVASGVKRVINVCSRHDDFQKIYNLCEKNKTLIVPAYGFHPWYVKGCGEKEIFELENVLIQNPDALLGECGLDGFKPEFSEQIKIFEAQLFLAQKYKRPMVIHAVKATEWFQNNWKKLPQKFVFHSYVGSKEFLKQVLDHGGYIGFNASVFRAKTRDEIINYVPENRILAETDAPYQAFNRNEKNFPAAIEEIVKKIADIRQENMEKFAEVLYKNSEEFIK